MQEKIKKAFPVHTVYSHMEWQKKTDTDKVIYYIISSTNTPPRPRVWDIIDREVVNVVIHNGEYSLLWDDPHNEDELEEEIFDTEEELLEELKTRFSLIN